MHWYSYCFVNNFQLNKEINRKDFMRRLEGKVAIIRDGASGMRGKRPTGRRVQDLERQDEGLTKTFNRYV